MAKKSSAPVPVQTVLTLTLTDDGKLLRSGMLLAKRGDLGVIRQFPYRTIANIATAILEATQELDALAHNRPTIPPPPPTGSEINKELEKLLDGHTEPDGTSHHMIENIYRCQPGQDWLDKAIAKQAEPEGDPFSELGDLDETPITSVTAAAQAALF